VRGLHSCGMLCFEGLNHAAHHIPGSEKCPASTGDMITRDGTAIHDLERNGFKVVSEEVTMKVNGKRIRADFVAKDGHGKLHVFEVKHGSGRLTTNQKASGVFDMSKPANTTQHLGGGAITPSSGSPGKFTVDTHGDPGIPLGGHGATHDATFNILSYN
jgi:hypothetical protein